MKQFALTILLLMTATTFTMGQSEKQMKDSIQHCIDNIEKYGTYNHNKTVDNPEDSNMKWNEILLNYLNEICKKVPATINYKFDSSHLLIATSEDNKFRIYSWNTESGGTMRFYSSILQYKTSNGIKTKILFDAMHSRNDSGEFIGPGEFYKQVYTIKTKENKTYYLPIARNILQSFDFVMSVSAYSIENDLLNDSTKIFQAKKKSLTSIWCEYGYIENNETEQPIHLSRDKQKLYIANINNDLKFTGNWLVYNFDGYKFVYNKNENKYQ